ncbi:hypothetical protein [Peribacillus sp. SCS-155]|uniref:hypothetical protein n=1 Tax=Peribacillus sedimenti TaxID=3115297 RepID=UPI0039059022
MTTMTTITFANNQKELDRKIERITQDHERMNPKSKVEISYLDPKQEEIHFLPHQTIQFLIGIQVMDSVK